MSHSFELIDNRFFTGDLDHWEPQIPSDLAQQIMTALENGQVVYLPKLNFSLAKAEQSLLSEPPNPKGAKNISYDSRTQRIGGLSQEDPAAGLVLSMMQRYHFQCTQLLNALCSSYQASHCGGRTSFRPVEIKGRQPVSYRKDDTRLHVDAFPSTPVNDRRILRVFSNINPDGESRSWRLGQPFAEVIQQFLPRVRRLLPFEAEILHCLKATRQKRSDYDHCMLQIHNRMKKDLDYQQQVEATAMEFPPGSTWIVYTDLVSHAALAGRFLLEQTYYPSLEKMVNPALSPQHQIRKLRSSTEEFL